MKYSPQQQQQQQQKERKSESEMSSVNATPSRASGGLQCNASAASGPSTPAPRRATTCRPLSTDMFAWMRVFRLATMLHQVGC
ncbi:PREDICTED: uncharacterized protein LOC105367481 isoform X2 [Ceratosolen solmsi marchali]|nr:PREDICTED: uncharacterized protein LOC105367481 isoform X2 [Ceratosolen solmsi marchali]XP_011504511.1 PREDICTED: uncharacterized protein LOC105367481 isoform X2 [Ceratosolen solmsi marchali]